MKEIWKSIKDYDGLYQVSNLGRIRSLERYTKRNCNKRNGGYIYFKGKIIVATSNGVGYLKVALYKEGICKQLLVHRLVAEAFIPNPNNLPCVNHKDENKTNNFVFVNEDGTVDLDKSNLEWCDYKYNANYGTKIERTSEKRINGKKSKPVVQYDLDGNIIKEFPSLREVERQTGFNCGSVAYCCLCRPKYKTAYGYKWKYKD